MDSQSSAPGTHLSGVPAAEYGNDYHLHLLEQYKLYVEMADRISQRRQAANAFFLTINTAIVGFLGITWPALSCAPQAWPLVLGVAGVAISLAWAALIRSYRKLNEAKFTVVGQIETFLPVRPYFAEWKLAGEGVEPALYRPLSHIEGIVPWVFATIHTFLVVVWVLRCLNWGMPLLLALGA